MTSRNLFKGENHKRDAIEAHNLTNVLLSDREGLKKIITSMYKECQEKDNEIKKFKKKLRTEKKRTKRKKGIIDDIQKELKNFKKKNIHKMNMGLDTLRKKTEKDLQKTKDIIILLSSQITEFVEYEKQKQEEKVKKCESLFKELYETEKSKLHEFVDQRSEDLDTRKKNIEKWAEGFKKRDVELKKKEQFVENEIKKFKKRIPEYKKKFETMKKIHQKKMAYFEKILQEIQLAVELKIDHDVKVMKISEIIKKRIKK